ncbi:hypothetical protein KVR01_005861 [Diaporthe batatas]|uniref:uncharacterized protein n=1 Tax=Diaporthe batatas TaxID=748121 RepID=UPI001D0595E2|nr:uncharacterized protein KVR01_005861 [Diaporthe batatas]KAG8163943.1 hypothetical protein KVR01_005861 [Diaporthe batatas]
MMPLYRVFPGLGLDDLHRRGLAERAMIITVLVFFQHFFEIVTAFFGTLSLYTICVRIPLRAWQVSQRHLGFVGGDDVELKAHRWRISLALAIFHGILLMNWFGAVMRCRWLAHRRRNHAGHWETPQNKIVVQVDDPGRDLGVFWPANMHTGTFITDVRRRLRTCEHCGTLSDRMYHCEQLGKCLPLFNHFCGALNVPVYLETLKPYLCGLFLLCLDGLLVIGSCVWTWSDKQLRPTAVEGSLLLVTILNFTYAGIMLISIGKRVALHNMVTSERGEDKQFRGTYMAAQEETPGGVIVRVRWLANNPWDLGRYNNFCALMGRPLSWLL